VEYAQGEAVEPPAPLVDEEGKVALPCFSDLCDATVKAAEYLRSDR